MSTIEHAWLPKATCDDSCVRAGGDRPGRPALATLRAVRRITGALLLLPLLPLLAVPMPGRARVQRLYCRMFLRCLGVRITVSGGPIRNLRGVLVVSGHVSWVDIFTIGAVLPGAFVARADLVDWPAVGLAARIMKVIPIDRASLRRLPHVVGAVADRLRAGQTVVAFPEGTTWCGLAYGPFRPAMFQAAVDAGRPVQPLRLTYHHRDGQPSTVTAFVGDDSLWQSLSRTVRARLTDRRRRGGLAGAARRRPARAGRPLRDGGAGTGHRALRAPVGAHRLARTGRSLACRYPGRP